MVNLLKISLGFVRVNKTICKPIRRFHSGTSGQVVTMDASKETKVSRIVTEIRKPETDNRQYRCLELTNQMKVVLISDPTTDKAAAAMDVHVGHMCDPKELPGLAHFCEHMLFLGTEKYPSENEYSKYLCEHGGQSNAFTSSDHTNYYFYVSPEFLGGALDRFSQFFLAPLFTESATDREVNAVNSEHEKNINNDIWRLEQLSRSTADPNHDYCHFGTGNKETLDVIPKSKGISVRDELLKFHSHWYSSNIMGLSILGKDSLDELQNMVVDLFGDVQNKAVDAPIWPTHPFGPEQVKRMGYVVPIKDTRKMSLSFPTPDLQPHYRSSPGHYFGHLIGHEGPGSLLSELKSKGWSNSLVAGPREGARGFGFFMVSADLTEEGIENIEAIVTLILEYIKMLRDEGPQEWVFKECQHLSAMTFRFKDKERPETMTCSLSACLHEFPYEEVLSGPYLMQEYRPETLEMVLNLLVPDNMQMAVVGKKFEGTTDCVEPWYGTHYSMKPMPEELLEKWRNVERNPRMHLPFRNEFIPTSFDLVPREDDLPTFPVLIKDTAFSRVWFKQDQVFLLPKAIMSIQLSSPLAYIDPLHSCLCSVFASLFQDSLNEYAYDADLAGLRYALASNSYGIFLSLRGYNDKQLILLDKIMEKLTTFQVDPKRFEILKERYQRGLKNFQLEQPHLLAMTYLSHLLAERAWSKEEELLASEELTVERLQTFIPQLLSKLHVEALVYGNATRQHALDAVAIVENRLQERTHTKPLLRSQLVKNREIQLPDDSHYVLEREHSVHPCSCIQVYYECSLQETRANVLLELLCQIIQEPCFNTLRTNEQLGYIVWSNPRRSKSALGLVVTVQSEHNPKYLDSRIEAFLHSMGNYLRDIPEDEFERHREALISTRLDKPKKLLSQNLKYWSEIMTQHYNFDRDNIEVAALRKLTVEDVNTFFKDLFNHDAPHRHKLAVHIVNPNVVPSGGIASASNETGVLSPDGLLPTPVTTQPVPIDDVTAFKSSMGLFPFMPPFIPLSSFAVEAKSKL